MIPALDIRGGRCVRLLQGRFDQETAYSADPLAVAVKYRAAGAGRLHVVDLDAAAASGDNRTTVRRLVAETGAAVQVAGGVRSREDVQRWLEAGSAAVVMGTTAVRNPELLALCADAFPGRVLAALDVRGGRPAVAGWTLDEGLQLDRLVESWSAARLGGIVVTSVDRDGTMAGPDLDLLRRTRASTQHAVFYSGGVSSLEDISSVAAAGAAGLIVGKALLEGRFELEAAIARA